MTTSTIDYTVWSADFERLSAAVESYVIEIDGDTYIDDDCPPDLARAYTGLLRIGYAHGFIR